MNPVMLWLLDGTAFYIGMVLVLGAGALLIRVSAGLLRPLLTVSALAGVAFVLLSAVPLPGWLYALWILPAGSILVLGNWPNAHPRLRLRAFTALLAATAGLVLVEGPQNRSPRVHVDAGQTIFVVGDSISAGLDTGERCWPDVLAAAATWRVVNLAQPGATVQSAQAQIRQIAEPNSLVLLEIGGNDLLNRRDVTLFGAQLDTLISELRKNGHQIVMFELPLFPLQNAYGGVQRAVAKRHGVPLIPRRHFARVLGLKDGSLDGLHLSQKGHDEMARRVATILSFDNNGPTQ